jgi:hypothetical protein
MKTYHRFYYLGETLRKISPFAGRQAWGLSLYGEKFSALPRAGRAAKVWTLANPTHRCSASTFELVIQIGEVASKMSQFDPDIKIRYAVRESRCTG